MSSPAAQAVPQRADGAALSVRRARFSPDSGCLIHYSRYSSARARPGDVVVVAHGFLRSQARMAGLAQALAASGVTALTLDFCADGRLAGNHFRNGMAMRALARAEGGRRLVYVGFSAGALAALVAGRNDPRSLGVVALDLVDAQGLGVLMAERLQTPLVALVGEPSPCNAGNNGLAVYAATPNAVVRRFPGAGHCAFESETDWLCRLVCPAGTSDPAAAREAIIQATVDAVAGLFAAADCAGSRARLSDRCQPASG
ncbi:alpha/beta hydrolase [Thiorhodococcus minor]|uniref:Alpha/beta hydrolase n=1 Tax=Thiorhodococcus minor TaxID=57489 RepID=A0A6M0K534_9GAMM|nr:alpha/beta hydrolase [Thiorhodococcus minor]NEV64033.1 alpha/beta hydrolase [Thiorhodococcus minor]